jgi:D-3-phosphoglycerate dehydrogenase / 2-oxoglutarate reductase
MSRILITPRSLTTEGHPALEMLEKAGYELAFCTPGVQPDEAELLRLLPGCIGYLAGVERVSARVIETAGDLKVIARNGVGIDNIDLEAARRAGIAIVRAEGANAHGVAELTIGLMLALTRAIPFSDGHLKRVQWQRRRGIELAGRTLGVIGCGSIGRKVASMALGLGMCVLACDPYPDVSFTPGGAFEYVDLTELLVQSDVVSLHCPPSPDGRPLITREAIANMKRGVYLINTARAGLLDEQALWESLEEGRVAGLGLDVFPTEPPGRNPLIEHDRVVATPHVGGFTEESIDRAVGLAVRGMLDYLQSNG